MGEELAGLRGSPIRTFLLLSILYRLGFQVRVYLQKSYAAKIFVLDTTAQTGQSFLGASAELVTSLYCGQISPASCL